MSGNTVSFEDFLTHAKDKAQCPKCEKPFDVLEYVKDPETGELIVKIECHGETHHEIVPKEELEDLETRRKKALSDIDKAAEVLKKPKLQKRRIVTIDDATRHFAKFKRFK